jgi:aspartyl-tRNA(Asn)/glutamyl-tRNA(Gln) amidotransferase subunit A
MAELTSLTIAAAADAISRGELSPVDLTEAYLARIERLDPAINAYITVTAEIARAKARLVAGELAAGKHRGPLHGIPVALKDLYDTERIRTTGGAKIYADRVPERDSTAARRLREAGAVLLGKLNTHELAWGVSTNNPHFGPTRNPWNTACIPGGSSGGSGAAIAAGLAAGTLGTDTGGSIRIPAALCGCVGLKPTFGLVSKAGVIPMSYGLDHAGPITRTVEDAAIVLQAIAGYDPEDYFSVPAPAVDYRAALAGGVTGLKVGYPNAGAEALHPDVRLAFEAAIGELARLGAQPQPVEFPGTPAEFSQAFALVVAESKQAVAKEFAERPQDFGADLQGYFSQVLPDALGIVAGQRLVYELGVRFRRLFETVDLVVTPTTPLPATPIGADTVNLGGEEIPVIGLMTALTWQLNAAHLPALSLPCGFSGEGLPIGLQVIGRPFDEATVLRAAHAYEQATDWHTRRPALEAVTA